ncbi:MAG: TAT-variant-translocated molybdopterin oxidoreductase, partial [Myxococcaceae bacterium]
MSAPTSFSLPVLSANGESLAPAVGDPTPAPNLSGSPFDREYWTSINEKVNGYTHDEIGPEFPQGADELNGVGRRDFVKLMGASLAFAGVTGCTSPTREKILPYNHKPPEVTPGNALHYATAFTVDGHATGLLVTAFEGRPTKVEGNPDHPTTLGASGIAEQASLLQLYDPSRARLIKRQGLNASRTSLRDALGQKGRAFAQKGGAGLSFLLEPTSSPQLIAQKAALQERFPRAKLYTYAPAFSQAYEGTKLAFGAPLQAQWDLKRADVIVSLDSDFLEARGENIALARAFADRRVPPAPMNRLYVAESRLSVTGMSADHRLRAKPSQLHPLALALGAAVGKRTGSDALNRLAGTVRGAGLDAKQTTWVEAVADDLVKARSAGVILPGARLEPATQAVVHAINVALGSTAARFKKPVIDDVSAGPSSLKALTDAIRAGSVDTLIITAVNPAYAGFADVDFAGLLQKVPLSVYHCLFEDETAPLCSWVVPATHTLESWGDTRASDGTVSLVQPLITPLFGGLTQAQLFSLLLGEKDDKELSPYDQLRAHWRGVRGDSGFERAWENWLATGIVDEPVTGFEAPALDGAAVANAATRVKAGGEGLELTFVTDYKVYDGRFSNNPWLQELPDPVTKITWDNALLMSTATANRLSLELNDVVALTVRGKSIELPVYILPGHADDALTVSLGYGREGSERIARLIGASAYALRHSDSPWWETGVTVSKVKRSHKLAITQEHWKMTAGPDDPRPKPALETTL